MVMGCDSGLLFGCCLIPIDVYYVCVIMYHIVLCVYELLLGVVCDGYGIGCCFLRW